MDFISNQEPQVREMLNALGLNNIESLFADIPEVLKCPRPSIDDGLSESEGRQLMTSLARQNTYSSFDSYLGGGAYEHYIPALVSAICSKSEFLTAYTPYQAEASQGMLQVIFEFQSAICALTGMDAANASSYDGASACAEAILMALRFNKERHKILIAATLHPHYRSVIDQYLAGHDVSIIEIPFKDNGELDRAEFNKHLDEQTCAILLQSPNFFGVMEEIKPLVSVAKGVGSLVIQCANPLSYGLYISPGESGVDIAVGDCQPFGLALNFGGPYAGYIACKQELVRQLPGRIVGETKDTQGRRGFVLTLQAREQHIRREKATSNICTNQALAALASLVAMLWYGKEGLPKLALTNYQRAAYLQSHLGAIEGIQILQAPIFNEFAVKFSQPLSDVQTFYRKHQIEMGLSLGRFFPAMEGWVLISVTETKSKAQLDRYISLAKEMQT